MRKLAVQLQQGLGNTSVAAYRNFVFCTALDSRLLYCLRNLCSSQNKFLVIL